MSEQQIVPNTPEFTLLDEIAQAEHIVEGALLYSGINPNTAPVRYSAAEKAARYAVYVALGITSSAESIPHSSTVQLDKTQQNQIRSIQHMGRFAQSQKRQDLQLVHVYEEEK